MQKSNNPIDEALLMEMFKKYENTRSTSIKNKIIEMNFPFVKYVVKKYLSEIGVDKNELISLGSFGLINAVETYDVNNGTKFSAYATKCILNYIKNNLYTVTDIKITHYNYAILKTINIITKKTGVTIQNNPIEFQRIASENPNIDEKIKDKIESYIRTRNVKYDEENVKETYEMEEKMIDNIMIDELRKKFETLTEKEKEVLRHRYGFYGSIHTLEDIGKFMNCTHQNISLTEKKALKKLRKKFDCKI